MNKYIKRPGAPRAATSKPKRSKKLKAIKTVAQAVGITAAYLAGIAILLWPAVDAARLG
ncbi:MAG: hypothetical protein ACR2QM_16440 [Longimicrobiales bacterium]